MALKRRGRPPKPKPIFSKNSSVAKAALEVVKEKKRGMSEASLNNLQQARESVEELRALPLTDRQAIILKALQAAGYNKSQSAALMDLSNARVSTIGDRANNGALDDLRVRAAKVVGSLLKGDLVGSMERISGSEILAAAKEVLSRTDPTIHKVEQKSLSIKTDLSPVERMQYLKALGIDKELPPPPPLEQLPAPEVPDAQFQVIDETKGDTTNEEGQDDV